MAQLSVSLGTGLVGSVSTSMALGLGSVVGGAGTGSVVGGAGTGSVVGGAGLGSASTSMDVGVGAGLSRGLGSAAGSGGGANCLSRLTRAAIRRRLVSADMLQACCNSWVVRGSGLGLVGGSSSEDSAPVRRALARCALRSSL